MTDTCCTECGERVWLGQDQFAGGVNQRRSAGVKLPGILPVGFGRGVSVAVGVACPTVGLGGVSTRVELAAVGLGIVTLGIFNLMGADICPNALCLLIIGLFCANCFRALGENALLLFEVRGLKMRDEAEAPFNPALLPILLFSI